MVIERRPETEGAVLVVGGGIGGMRAALDLAEAGLKAYLVEKDPGLGGRVAQLGYMFPTHDCVLCRGTSDHGYGCTRPAISPAFIETNQHPNLEVMTRTEILAADGQAGNFSVTVRHHPRYVDIDRCTNCGLCAVVCPRRLPSEMQESLVTRNVIHKSAPRALPNAYYVDKGDDCTDCRRCEMVCPTNAVNLDETAWDEKIHVSAVILALGYRLSDASQLEEYGYGRFPNVVHSMQYERYVSRSGPTEGMVLRPSDNKPPQKIAWLQCIGSRDQDHPYCSSICCMYATKEAVLTKQRLGGDAHCQVFMMDERAFNKEFNTYFHQSTERYGVEYTRCRISDINEDGQTNDLIIRYLDQTGSLREKRFDMVVLSVGVLPPAGAQELSQKLGFDLNDYGFCQTDKFNPLETSHPGIYVCGAFATPKEIAETIIDAAGAAGDVMRLFSDRLGNLPSTREHPFMSKGDFMPERNISGENPRVGVFVCRCTPSIDGTVDVDRLVTQAKSYANVVYSTDIDYGCFPDGIEKIKHTITNQNLNRVVVAGCSHRTHESLFQRAVREVGLNPYLMEMTNIREFCAWVHPGQPELATRKAMEMVRVAVERANLLEPVYKTEIVPEKRALIIGGGISGMSAALAIADAGFDVVIVERSAALGGNVHNINYVVEGDNPQRLLRDLVNRIVAENRITVYTRTEVVEHSGHIGAYHAVLRNQDGSERTVSHGVTIVAVGGRESHGTKYLQGQHPKVVTQLELEEIIAHRPDEITGLNEVVMIQCVRPEGVDQDYCSRICCTTSIKNALRIKVANPDCQVIVLYKDIITYGFREQYYTEARRRGVLFVRYDDENEPVTDRLNGGIRVSVREPMLGREMVFNPDLLVLSTAVIPAEGSDALSKILKVPLSSEGFFLEAHIKMRPMDFMEEGIFICGMAHYPKFIEESISHALATAARAITILSKEPLYVGGTIAVVDQSKCVGCLTCVRTCPFEIPTIHFNEMGVGDINGAAYIDPTLCHGCGTCTAECPAVAIQLINNSDLQVMVPDAHVLGSWVEA
jgi:heterodisulfide reductase subunit A